jgi:glycosyltransferase involved in cell wall biosynthesis
MMHERPLVTFFLVTYNQERYVREAIEGAFSQTYSPLEIVISDDCSRDGTYGVIEEMCAAYEGPHRVVLNRNEQNLGLIGHINKIDSLASGELIVYAAGDDVSLPERTRKIVERYLESGKRILSIHSDVELIDIAGNRSGCRVPPVIRDAMTLEDMVICTAMTIGATAGFTKDLQRAFGPIRYPRAIEDLVMGLRSALNGGLEYIPEPLVRYRYESGITAIPDSRRQIFATKVQREVSELEMHLAVYAQRRLDIIVAARLELLPILKAARDRKLLQRKVFVGNCGVLRLFAYASKRGLSGVLFKAWMRRKKWQVFFPLKGLMKSRSC